MANLDLDQFAKGAETVLGKISEGGVDVSGGEWQKIALGRSFASNASLRILDEPTASLDPISESDLYAKYSRLSEKDTMILISHRLGSTKIADRILVLDKGGIVEEGTHYRLMEYGGLYAKMYSVQSEWYL